MTVNILNKLYEVHEVDRFDNALQMGSADTCRSEIRVRSGLPANVSQEVIIHEIIHILNEELDLGMDETLILRLGILLNCVLISNMDLLIFK